VNADAWPPSKKRKMEPLDQHPIVSGGPKWQRNRCANPSRAAILLSGGERRGCRPRVRAGKLRFERRGIIVGSKDLRRARKPVLMGDRRSRRDETFLASKSKRLCTGAS